MTGAAAAAATAFDRSTSYEFLRCVLAATADPEVEPFEVRCLSRDNQRHGGVFDSIGTALDALEEVTEDDRFFGYYVGSGVVDTAARPVTNALARLGKGEGVADAQVIRYRILTFDIDAERAEKGRMATEAELAGARKAAKELFTFLRSAGWPDPAAVVATGNGMQLCYRIDLKASEHSLVKRVVANMAERFGVDSTVTNPAQLHRIAGTMNRKGADPAAWRLAALKLGNAAALVTREQLEAQATPPKPQAKPAGDASDPATFSESCLVVYRLLKAHGIGYSVGWAGDRRKWVVDCPWADKHTTPDVSPSGALWTAGGAAIRYSCWHDHCAKRAWADFKAAFKGSKPEAGPEPQAHAQPEAAAFPRYSEWLDSVPQSVVWDVDALIPQGGMTLLAAYMKRGKSTLIGGLLGRLVWAAEGYAKGYRNGDGNPAVSWLGHAVSYREHRVLWANPENHPRQIAQILEDAGVDPQHSDYITVLDHRWPGWRDVFAGGFEGLADLLRRAKEGGHTFLFLDTGNTFFARAGGDDENSNALVSRFAALLREGGCSDSSSVMVSLHTPKASDGTDIRAIRGAGAWSAEADQILLLADPDTEAARADPCRRQVRIVGRFGGESPNALQITYDQTTGLYVPVEDAAVSQENATEARGLEARLLEVFASASGLLTATQAVRAAGVNRKFGFAAVRRLKTAGRLRAVGSKLALVTTGAGL